MEDVIKFPRRIALDGLRGILSILVILFHFHIPFFNQGYIGVDCFFVLSGFLITSIILVEIQNTKTLNYYHFYARRCKRLMPASILVLLCTSILYKLLYNNYFIESNRLSFIAGLSFWENIYLIINLKDYFGISTEETPLMHYWSLSIEEQYYFIYPFILHNIIKYDYTKQYKVTKLSFALCILVLLYYQYYQLLFSYIGSSIIYFSSIFRIYQLLSGSLISVFIITYKSKILDNIIIRILFHLLSTFGFIILLLLSTNMIPLSSSNAGVIAVFCSCVIITGLEFHSDSILSKLLSLHIFQFFGKLSYSMYLWHYPIILFLNRYIIEFYWYHYIILFLFITLVSYLTWIFIEYPCKSTSYSDKRVLLYAILCMIISLFIIILLFFPLTENTYFIRENHNNYVAQSYTSKNQFNNDSIGNKDNKNIDNIDGKDDIIDYSDISSNDNSVYNGNNDYNNIIYNDIDNIDNNDTKYQPVKEIPSTVYSSVCQHPQNEIYFIGDSFSAEWHLAFKTLRENKYRGENITFGYWYGIANLINTEQYDKNYKVLQDTINEFEKFWNTNIEGNSNEKVIFLSCLSFVELIFIENNTSILPGTNEWTLYLYEKIKLQYTSLPNTTVVVIEPHYPPPFELYKCEVGNVKSYCRSEYKAEKFNFVDSLLGIFTNIHEEVGDDFQIINFNDFVCPNNTCKGKINGEIVFRDSLHLTENFALANIQKLDEKLRPYFKGVSGDNICNFE